jgi:hypothetical protein
MGPVIPWISTAPEPEYLQELCSNGLPNGPPSQPSACTADQDLLKRLPLLILLRVCNGVSWLSTASAKLLNCCPISVFLTERKILSISTIGFVSFSQHAFQKRAGHLSGPPLHDCMIRRLLYFRLRKRRWFVSFQSRGDGQGTNASRQSNPTSN